MNAWASFLYRHDRACVYEYTALIVTSARDGAGLGLGVELHGFWTRRRAPGEYVVTRARVEQPRY